ncbi:hypothetical protein D9757_002717 [Collybiopsis confluens]|uniref:RNA-dependent RNA polymerase n=1 Tax=Collybiopsis confluens TaxID=2823264 RepID=A0A8H5ME07_9AGAR|nr:hypothetical protein D9757_002717 [Collybiopsis confluens]
MSFNKPLPTQPLDSSRKSVSSSGSISGPTGILRMSTSLTLAENTSVSTENMLAQRSDSDISNVFAPSVLLGKRAASDTLFSDGRARKISRKSDSEPVLPLYPPVFVAYSRSVQTWLDSRSLPWGVQWEIARLVSLGRLKYEKVYMNDLDKLKAEGSNVKAVPQVEKILSRKPDDVLMKTQLFINERKAKFPFEELDLEDRYLREDAYGALGFNKDDDWFGGKIVFAGKLKILSLDSKKRPLFKVELERPDMGASSRFTRRFGSKSFMRIRIPKDLSKYSDDLIELFRRPFIVSGKVFRAFLEKEKNVFFFMTNESPEGPSASPLPDGLSFLDFLNWHNPLHANQNQSAAKYASRFTLGFSTSVPGLLLEPGNIVFIDDIVSNEGSDMTDGAGFINKMALKQLRLKFDWAEWPTAIQCRVAGAKGMLMQHPNDDHPEPRVYIRKSMNKIKYPELGSDRAHCAIDVLRACHPRFACKLSSEIIIILAENGVPEQVFCDLLDETLDSLVASLTTWESQSDLEELWRTLSRLGGVFSARSARRKSSLARVNGYSERDALEADDGDEDGLDNEAEEGRSTAWWEDEVSGQPSSLEETVMRLLDGGFTPEECPVMRDKLKKILDSQISNCTANFRIVVPMSFTAFILPDPTPAGVLEEGEIYFRSSTNGVLMADGLYTDVLVGPAVVTRHPSKLPTAAQKWIAVDRPELKAYTDVIIISTKGARRGADWLGSADYDGDKATALYDPGIVGTFINADLKLGEPRDDIKTEFFEQRTETVSNVLKSTPPTSENTFALIHALQSYLLGGIKSASLVGKASNMHDFLLYTRGLRDPETIRMAHIFSYTLDGMKTGLRIKPEKWKEDTSRYHRGSMVWKEAGDKRNNGDIPGSEDNALLSRRPENLSPFIMDRLQKHAEKKRDEKMGNIETICSSTHAVLDEQLAAPWTEANNLAERGNVIMRESLVKIKAHVESMRVKHRASVAGKTFTGLSIETRQDKLRSLSREFASPPEDLLISKDEVSRLQASYAYQHDFDKERSWTRFPWDVAMEELVHIKAKVTGQSRTVVGEFYKRFNLRKNR